MHAWKLFSQMRDLPRSHVTYFSSCPGLTLTWRNVFMVTQLICPFLHCPTLHCSTVLSGAGRFPTANSVLNDLVRLSQNRTSPPFPLSSEVTVKPNYAHTFYIRIKSRNTVGTPSTHQSFWLFCYFYSSIVRSLTFRIFVPLLTLSLLVFVDTGVIKMVGDAANEAGNIACQAAPLNVFFLTIC